MEEQNAKKSPDAAKPVGPSKRERIVTAVLGVTFVIVLVVVALVQKFKG